MLRHPGMDSLPGLLGQFKLNWTTSFLLHNNGTLSDTSGHDDITGPQGHQVTTTELAVYGQVKQSKVSRFPMDLEQDSD
jgi:hypothetical protein